MKRAALILFIIITFLCRKEWASSIDSNTRKDASNLMIGNIITDKEMFLSASTGAQQPNGVTTPGQIDNIGSNDKNQHDHHSRLRAGNDNTVLIANSYERSLGGCSYDCPYDDIHFLICPSGYEKNKKLWYPMPFDAAGNCIDACCSHNKEDCCYPKGSCPQCPTYQTVFPNITCKKGYKLDPSFYGTYLPRNSTRCIANSCCASKKSDCCVPKCALCKTPAIIRKNVTCKPGYYNPNEGPFLSRDGTCVKGCCARYSSGCCKPKCPTCSKSSTLFTMNHKCPPGQERRNWMYKDYLTKTGCMTGCCAKSITECCQPCVGCCNYCSKQVYSNITCSPGQQKNESMIGAYIGPGGTCIYACCANKMSDCCM